MRRSLAALVLSVGLVGLVGLVVAGCGSDSTSAGSGTPAPSPSGPGRSDPSRDVPAALPTGVDRPCPVGAKVLNLRGPHGVHVFGYAIGTGQDAVVLEHQAGEHIKGVCDAWSTATWLAGTQHLQVVLVARCGYDGTTCPRAAGTGARQAAAVTQPAIDYARRHGATRVTLVGASSGAADALQAASVLHGIAAVVALSPDQTDTGAPLRAANDRLPTLIAYAPGDGLCPPKVEQAWFRQLRGHPKRLVVDTERHLHGWQLVLDTVGDPRPFADRVAAWTHGHYA
jgi:dienelactone hydrolase